MVCGCTRRSFVLRHVTVDPCHGPRGTGTVVCGTGNSELSPTLVAQVVFPSDSRLPRSIEGFTIRVDLSPGTVRTGRLFTPSVTVDTRDEKKKLN